MKATFVLAGNWTRQIEVPLRSALEVSMDVFGYDAEKASRQCVGFMAQSASKLTRVAPKKRPVEPNPDFKHLLRKKQYKELAMRGGMTAQEIGRWYKQWRAVKLKQGYGPGSQILLYANVKDTISNIGNRRIAQKSWMWGFGKGKPIPGVSELYSIGGRQGGQYMSGTGEGLSVDGIISGYVLYNKLGYIMAALPAGWERIVEQLAINRIMGRARQDLYAKWPGAFRAAAAQAKVAA